MVIDFFGFMINENYELGYNPVINDPDFARYSKIIGMLKRAGSRIPQNLGCNDAPTYYFGSYSHSNRTTLVKLSDSIPRQLVYPVLEKIINDLKKSLELEKSDKFVNMLSRQASL